MKLKIAATQSHVRGKLYEIRANGKRLSVLFTFHAIERVHRWELTDREVLRALLYPEEVLRGHRKRFIAHRRIGRHVVRVVYEYEDRTPVVVTVYYPFATRYFKGGGTREDQVLS